LIEVQSESSSFSFTPLSLEARNLTLLGHIAAQAAKIGFCALRAKLRSERGVCKKKHKKFLKYNF
jgi:hypothetical protein